MLGRAATGPTRPPSSPLPRSSRTRHAFHRLPRTFAFRVRAGISCHRQLRPRSSVAHSRPAPARLGSPPPASSSILLFHNTSPLHPFPHPASHAVAPTLKGTVPVIPRLLPWTILPPSTSTHAIEPITPRTLRSRSTFEPSCPSRRQAKRISDAALYNRPHRPTPWTLASSVTFVSSHTPESMKS